jgi:hypothetical protein
MQAGDPAAAWKLNLDFQTQKRTILESNDTKFLNMVAEKDESIQFRKLAQTRLSQVGA